jgi:dephospho-CoA kinase
LKSRPRTRPRFDAETPRRLIIGLTGPIAAGKSTVAALLAERGAHVIDADRVYRSLLQTDPTLSRRIGEAFGSGVVTGNTIDRAALAEIVFNDPVALTKLERITHPVIEERIFQEVGDSTARLIAIEAVKLIQAGLADRVDSVWVVTAGPDVRLRRLVTSRGLSVAAAKERMAASDFVVPSSVTPDVVIDNSGDLNVTREAVDDALGALLESSATHTGSERFKP